METTTDLKHGQWTEKEKKIAFFALVGICALGILVMIFRPTFVPHLIPTALPQTKGFVADSGFQFTLSPNNRWIVYLEPADQKITSLNLAAFDTMERKKYSVAPAGRLRFGMENGCWSQDSRYCVFPAPSGEGQPANPAPDLIIDFTGNAGPILKSQLPAQDGSQTYDEISPRGFGCSDCQSVHTTGNNFGEREQGDELVSPDGRFVARQKWPDWAIMRTPDLYVLDTRSGIEYFVAEAVYYDMHFTSDSTRLYFYSCLDVGGCQARKNRLYYVDLFPSTFSEKLPFWLRAL